MWQNLLFLLYRKCILLIGQRSFWRKMHWTVWSVGVFIQSNKSNICRCINFFSMYTLREWLVTFLNLDQAHFQSLLPSWFHRTLEKCKFRKICHCNMYPAEGSVSVATTHCTISYISVLLVREHRREMGWWRLFLGTFYLQN